MRPYQTQKTSIRSIQQHEYCNRSVTSRRFSASLVEVALWDIAGKYYAAPDGSGLGAELDWDYIKAHKMGGVEFRAHS